MVDPPSEPGTIRRTPAEPLRGKPRRNLHLVAALGLALTGVAALLLQRGVADVARDRLAPAPVSGAATGISEEEPEIRRLRAVIMRQREAEDPSRAAGSKVTNSAGTAARSRDDPGAATPGAIPPRAAGEDIPADLGRYESAKREAAIAGSRMLVISRADAASVAAPPGPQGATGTAAAAVATQPVISHEDATGAIPQVPLPEGVNGGILLSAGRATDIAPSAARVADAVRRQGTSLVAGDRQAPPGKTIAGPADRAVLQLRAPASRVLLMEGSVIPCVLLTEISSNLPGMITAQVSDDIFDGLQGRRRIIPRGSRLVGEYASRISAGQQRLEAAFHRLLLPDGTSVELPGMRGADAGGQSGLKDQVDTRFWARFGEQFLTAGLAAVLQRSDGGVTVIGSSGGAIAADAAGQILVETARGNLQRDAGVGPVITIRRGYTFQVLVNRDMDFSRVVGAGG